MYIFDRQFSGPPHRRKSPLIGLPPSWHYTLEGNGAAKIFLSPVLMTPPPVFKPIPVTLETLRPPQKKGDPFTLETQRRFRDIATLNGLVRKLNIPLQPGNPRQWVEFSVGQGLLDTGIFKPDPSNPKNFQIPLVHSIAFPADPTDSSKLAPAEEPFPVVLMTHGQHLNYFWIPRRDSGGRILTKTVSGSKLPRLEWSRLDKEIESFLGFKDLQLELAKHGIVSISINNNPANIFDDNALLQMRSDLILAHLDHLESLNKDSKSPFFQKLDFKRVGLMGHSRGGDAVVKAFHDNQNRFGIKAVVSLAPLDQTGLLEPNKRLKLTDPSLHYLVIYGSHDGDVGNWSCGVDLGSGFRHYDRATCRRSMLFIHGATHNRFNTVWKEDERRVKNEIRNGKVGINRILTPDEHTELTKEYVGGWFRMVLNREVGLAGLFNGSQVVSVQRGPLTVSTQWSFGKRIRVIDDFEGPKASENRLKGKSTATPKAIIKTSIGRISGSFPHQTNALLAGKIPAASSIYSTEIPNTTEYPGGPRNRDFTLFDLLTFRMTKSFNLGVSPTDIMAQPFPRFRVRLKDDRGGSSTVDHTDIYAANAHAPTRPYHRIDWGEPCIEGGQGKAAVVITLNPLETLRVPLTLFSKANPKIDLSNIRFLEFEFMSVRQDQIFIDDLQLIKG